MIGQTTEVLLADLENHGSKEVGEGIARKGKGMMALFKAKVCQVARPEFKTKHIKKNVKILTTITRIKKS